MEIFMSNNIEKKQNVKSSPEGISDLSKQSSPKKMLIMFIVDNSENMSGAKIAKVNEIFGTIIPALQKIQIEIGDTVEIKIAVMTFGTNANWIVSPTKIMEYNHIFFRADGGGSEYGNMLKALESKLSRKSFMSYKGKIAAPIIVLIINGTPNDDHYENIINDLNRNIWFSASERYAVLMSHHNSAKSAVESFVSDPVEGIVTLEDLKNLPESIRPKTIHTVSTMSEYREQFFDSENADNAALSFPCKDPFSAPFDSHLFYYNPFKCDGVL